MTVQPASESEWHLDKRIPIALVLGLLLQTAGLGWFAATLNTRVQTNTAELERLDVRLEDARSGSMQRAVQLGRIEEQIKGLRGDIRRALDTQPGDRR